jgi:hypothetical protein
MAPRGVPTIGTNVTTRGASRGQRGAISSLQASPRGTTEGSYSDAPTVAPLATPSRRNSAPSSALLGATPTRPVAPETARTARATRSVSPTPPRQPIVDLTDPAQLTDLIRGIVRDVIQAQTQAAPVQAGTSKPRKKSRRRTGSRSRPSETYYGRATKQPLDAPLPSIEQEAGDEDPSDDSSSSSSNEDRSRSRRGKSSRPHHRTSRRSGRSTEPKRTPDLQEKLTNSINLSFEV